MTLKVHNTLTRKKETFQPLDEKNVRMYVCGPTVYDYAHIGNARPVVAFDMLFRLLRHFYGESHVTYARNITDIDDKIMKRAADEGVATEDIAQKYADIYAKDMAALNALPPTLIPKATDHLPQMIAMIQKLIDEGCAYEAEGHVLFHVPSMDQYGRLSGRDRDQMIAGARVDVAPYKKDSADFVLWKPSTDSQPGWDSLWGRGRPGWHLECSAMIEAHLGDTIDIHAGGLDLVFPHHENEIAQSECAHKKPFVRYWMHNGYLTMSGEKMSKSIGNVKTVHELLDHWPGEALRLTLLSAHYRQPLDFNADIVEDQKRRLDRWYRITGDVKPDADVPQPVLDALSDDLNTPKAIAALEELATEKTASALKAGANFMGLLQQDAESWFKGGDGVDEKAIEALIEERVKAKKNKNFARADEIRDQLAANGILLEDGPDGTSWRRK